MPVDWRSGYGPMSPDEEAAASDEIDATLEMVALVNRDSAKVIRSAERLIEELATYRRAREFAGDVLITEQGPICVEHAGC